MDARRLQDRPLGGVGRMLANLVPLISPAVVPILLTDARRPAIEGPWEQHALASFGRLPEPVWLQRSVSRWLRGFTGVFHGTFNALPGGWQGPSVLTVHDLSFEHHPEDFRPDKRVVWRRTVRASVRAASVLTTTTEFVRRGLVDTYDIDPANVVLVPPNVDPVFGAAASEAAWDRPVSGPYVVALGGARRRGLEVAVAAWRRLRAGGCDWSLVVAGGDSLRPEPGLVVAGQLDDQRWAALLAGADAFCYPTRYEGFGLPALEAAASGTPVICAPVGALPEVLAEAAEWCEEPTVEAIAAGLERLAGDPERRRRLSAAGRARVAELPSWAESAAALVEAYLVAMGERA